MRKILFLYTLIVLIAGTLASCNKEPKGDTLIYPNPDAVGTYAKGADLSWVTEMEAADVKFYNPAGEQQDLYRILKDKGINTVRLRVWVNPENNWCNASDVLYKARRARNANMRIMIDFHYSDSWADPGQQTKPKQWAALSFTDLKTAVFTHTADVLNLLKKNFIYPEWVQVGNETNNGMLWEDGKASVNMKNFAELVQAGYDAVKSVDQNTKVIVHLSNGYDNAMYRWMFDGLKQNGAKWDVIGMSMYPSITDWQAKNAACLTNMQDMITRYGSEIMISEVGMPADQPDVAKAFISDLIAKTKSLPANKGLGVFYWEPECHNSWNGYKLGAFDDSGKPTVALDAFKD